MRPRPTPKAVALAIIALISLALALTGRGGPLALAAASLLPPIMAVAHAEAGRAGRELYRVSTEREAPARAGEGVDAEVRLWLTYRGATPPSYVEALDHPDRRLRPERPGGRVWLAPGREEGVSYTVRPAPGLSRIRGVTLASGDPLGLYTVRRHVPLRSATAVSPMPLPLIASPRYGYRGLHEPAYSRRRGLSLEFYQLREYVPGDDVRLIHWPTSARVGRPMVREGLETVSSDLAMLVDLSMPVWPGTPGMASADWIMRTALRLALAVTSGGGTLWAYLLRGEYWEEWGPLRGREARDLLAARLSLHGPDTAERRLGLETALSRLARAVPAGTRIVVLAGPAVSHRGLARAIAETGSRAIVGIFLPTGSTRGEEAVRAVEARLYERAAEEYRRAGARAVLIRSPGEVAWFARTVIESLAPGRA